MEERNTMEELKQLCSPVAEYLRENYNPHVRLIISQDYIKLAINEIGISLGSKDD